MRNCIDGKFCCFRTASQWWVVLRQGPLQTAYRQPPPQRSHACCLPYVCQGLLATERLLKSLFFRVMIWILNMEFDDVGGASWSLVRGTCWHARQATIINNGLCEVSQRWTRIDVANITRQNRKMYLNMTLQRHPTDVPRLGSYQWKRRESFSSTAICCKSARLSHFGPPTNLIENSVPTDRKRPLFVSFRRISALPVLPRPSKTAFLPRVLPCVVKTSGERLRTLPGKLDAAFFSADRTGALSRLLNSH